MKRTHSLGGIGNGVDHRRNGPRLGKMHRLKFDQTKRKAFLKRLCNGQGRTAAAVACGVTVRTIERHVNENEDFAVAVSEAEMHRDDKIENALFRAALRGNVTACQVWLYNRRPERWKDQRRKLQISGTAGGPIPVRAVEEMSDEELARIIQEGRRGLEAQGDNGADGSGDGAPPAP